MNIEIVYHRQHISFNLYLLLNVRFLQLPKELGKEICAMNSFGCVMERVPTIKILLFLLETKLTKERKYKQKERRTKTYPS